ncbi:MAG: hypothetical protein DMG63_02260 [Acidobacteria bacterium]|nr:MAG: hypothetical protein DMG63_02260 [Acidobacteriota bacterium]
MLGPKVCAKETAAKMKVAIKVVMDRPFMARYLEVFTSIGRYLVTRGEPRTALGNSISAVLLNESGSQPNLVG